MTWPQLTVLCVLVFGSLLQLVAWSKDANLSSDNIAVRFIVLALAQGAYAWVLGEGGFW